MATSDRRAWRSGAEAAWALPKNWLATRRGYRRSPGLHFHAGRGGALRRAPWAPDAEAPAPSRDAPAKADKKHCETHTLP